MYGAINTLIYITHYIYCIHFITLYIYIGEEVFNSYGRRKNDNLLLDYGFAMLDNEHDCVSVYDVNTV